MNGRRGVVLVSVLLLLLVATALAHGVLLLARAERVSSEARARSAASDAVAAATLDESVRRAFPADLSGAPIWARRVLYAGSPTEGIVSVRRLSAESWWMEHLTDSLTRRRTGLPGWLVWWMDPLARVESLGAVLSVGRDAPWTLRGTVDRSRFGGIPAGLDAASCGFGAHEVTRFPELVRVLPATPPGLGLLSFDSVMARTDAMLDGSGTPGPREDAGRCAEDDEWNWGDPERLGGPCGRLVAVRAARSGLRVDGGVGQAGLVVQGDLELSSDARLYGFIMTSGTLTIRDRAELHGVAVARGGILVEAGAGVYGSACWAARALRAARTQWMPWPSPLPGISPIGP